MTNLQYSIIKEQSCRICLEDDEYNLITPCNCSGTMKYVHKNCINRWRHSVDYNPIKELDRERYTTCGICKEEYEIYDSQCSLFCLSIFDLIVVIFRILHLLYIGSVWGLYGIGVKTFRYMFHTRT